MKEIETIHAEGHVICHDITVIIKDEIKDTAFRKGTLLRRRIFRSFCLSEKITSTCGKKKRGCCTKMMRRKFWFPCAAINI